MHSLAQDLDQAALIPNKTDTYYLKWRYYFQEYVPATAPATPASHKHLHHWVFLIDAQVRGTFARLFVVRNNLEW